MSSRSNVIPLLASILFLEYRIFLKKKKKRESNKQNMTRPDTRDGSLRAQNGSDFIASSPRHLRFHSSAFACFHVTLLVAIKSRLCYRQDVRIDFSFLCVGGCICVLWCEVKLRFHLLTMGTLLARTNGGSGRQFCSDADATKGRTEWGS